MFVGVHAFIHHSLPNPLRILHIFIETDRYKNNTVFQNIFAHTLKI